MEDNQYPTPKKSFNGCLWMIVVAVLLMAATAVLVFTFRDSITKTVIPKGETVCKDTTKIEEPVLTIQEILDFRKSIIEGKRIDSIFLAMPDAILIDILMTHGTSLSNSDIVLIYESNKEHYNSVLKGATIQRDIIVPMESQTTPDSVKNHKEIPKTSVLL